MADINDWNAKIVNEFRANAGIVAAQVQRMPGFQTYADSTTRVIPVIALERAG